MDRHNSRGLIRDIYHLPLLFKVLDSVLIYISLFVLVSIFDRVEWGPIYNSLAIISTLLFIFAAESFSLYRSWRGVSFFSLINRVVIVWGITIFSLMVLGYMTKSTAGFSRLLVSTWFISVPVLLLFWRLIFQQLLKLFRSKGFNSRQVALLGANALSEEVIKHIKGHSSLGMHVEGIYDDRKLPRDEKLKNTVVGSSDDLVEKCKNGQVDLIYITLPMKADSRIKQVIDKLSDTTVSVYLLPDIYTYQLFNGRWSNFAGHPVVSVFETPFSGIDSVVKRVQDVIVSLVILTLIAPLLLAISITVKTTSAGPVLFKQRRYGIAGEDITVWKFRSMTTQDNGDDVKQATKGDARITRLGAFLRRTSLDELPQFFNVLTGDMSIVGPRPHAAVHNELYRNQIRGYMLRHAVKPGITGWAQINGWRGETDTLDKMESRIEHDHWYISHWSLWLDIKIIFLTVFKGFVSSKAY